jgi:hypothetical protein
MQIQLFDLNKNLIKEIIHAGVLKISKVQKSIELVFYFCICLYVKFVLRNKIEENFKSIVWLLKSLMQIQLLMIELWDIKERCVWFK